MYATPKPVRWDVFLAIAILMVLTALNIYESTLLQLWYDEGWTLMEITGALTADGLQLPTGGPQPGQVFLDAMAEPGPFQDVAASLYAHDIHPPVYFQTLWAWTHVFGTGPLGMRSLSVVCIAACAAVLFWHSRRTTGPAAVLALTFMLSSPGAAYAAVNARGYGLGLLLVCIALVAVLRAMDSTRPAKWTALAGTAVGVAAMTHYFTILTLLPAGAVAMVFLARKRQWRAMLVGALAAAPGLAAMALIWLPQHLYAREEQYAGFDTWPLELLSLYRVFVSQFTPYTVSNIVIAVAITVAGAMLLAAFLRQGFHKRTDPEVAIPFAGLFGCLLALLVLFWATEKTLVHFSVARYGMLVLPSMALLLAQLPGARWNTNSKLVGAAAVVLIVVGVGPRMDRSSFNQPWADHKEAEMGTGLIANDPTPESSLVVLVGDEPGRIGAFIQTVPSDMDAVHAPTTQHLVDVLATHSYQTLHMRPLPRPWAHNKPFFSDDLLDALQKAGYTQMSIMTWKRTTSIP